MKKEIKKMTETPFCIYTNKMECWRPDSIIQGNGSNAEFKMIVFSDSTDCTGCYIKQLNLWNDFLYLGKKTKGKFVFMFIMEVEPTQYNMVYNALREAELRHSVYLDTLCVFRNNNPQLPESRLFHTFVVNRDNKAVLVGNPIKNEKIEKMFLTLLTDSLLNNGVAR